MHSVRAKTKNRSIRRWNYLFLLTLSIVFASIWLGGHKQLQAQGAQPVEIASRWQQASFPVENFQGYTSLYGYRISPTTGQRQFHRGLDLAAPLGSYVRNWWAGEVISVSDHTNCGTMIEVQSGPWQHVYCHLSGHVEKGANGSYLSDRNGGIQLWEGQQIPVGARIGRVGMTGQTTGPHLHWGLTYSGESIDPALVLQEMFNQQAKG